MMLARYSGINTKSMYSRYQSMVALLFFYVLPNNMMEERRKYKYKSRSEFGLLEVIGMLQEKPVAGWPWLAPGLARPADPVPL